MLAGLIPLAQETALEVELLIKAGGLAAIIALFGLLFVVPLFLSQRREIRRLLRWQELDPQRGDEGAEHDIPTGADLSPAAGRVAATAAAVPAAAGATGASSSGRTLPRSIRRLPASTAA